VVTQPLDDGQTPALAPDRDRRESSPSYLANGELTFLVERKGGVGRYQVVRRPAGGDSLQVLVSSERPIAYFAISPDGSHLAYIVTPAVGAGRDKPTSVFFFRGPGAVNFTQVPVQPGETLASPSL
jgi:hypothetical protein